MHAKRTQDGTRILFSVPTSFVLTDNTCILSCAIFPAGTNSPLNDDRKKRKTDLFYFIVFVKIMQTKQRSVSRYYRLSSEDQNNKNA